jgi:hypothetical protein
MKPYIAPTINKPLYETDEGSTIGLYDLHVRKAIKQRRTILVSTYWRGQYVEKEMLPKAIKYKCEVIEKEYKRPGEPMKEYVIFIPRPLSPEEESLKLIKEGLI